MASSWHALIGGWGKFDVVEELGQKEFLTALFASSPDPEGCTSAKVLSRGKLMLFYSKGNRLYVTLEKIQEAAHPFPIATKTGKMEPSHLWTRVVALPQPFVETVWETCGIERVGNLLYRKGGKLWYRKSITETLR